MANFILCNTQNERKMEYFSHPSPPKKKQLPIDQHSLYFNIDVLCFFKLLGSPQQVPELKVYRVRSHRLRPGFMVLTPVSPYQTLNFKERSARSTLFLCRTCTATFHPQQAVHYTGG
jgi:hypothetical protein